MKGICVMKNTAYI